MGDHPKQDLTSSRWKACRKLLMPFIKTSDKLPQNFLNFFKMCQESPQQNFFKMFYSFFLRMDLWQNIVFNFFFSEFRTLLKDYIHDHKI